ncbi:MAG TPA: S9 family peptidase [Steroidobacteraceae bacterium]
MRRIFPGQCAAAKAALCLVPLLLLTSISRSETAAAERPPPQPLPYVAPRISAEDFGALPFISRPILSPDGSKLLARVYSEGQVRLAVIGLGAAKSASRVLAIPERRDMLWYRWAGEDKILLSLGATTRFGGEEVYTSRLSLINLSNNKASLVGKRSGGFDGDTVIHVDKDGHSLLLTMQESIYEYPSVWRVDLDTMESTRVVKAQVGVWDWYADAAGIVRSGIGRSGKRWWLLYRKSAQDSFHQVHEATEDDSGDIERFIPLDGTDKGYAVANKKTGRYGLYYYDFATSTLGDAVFEHPQVDIDDFRESMSGEIEAVFYTDDRSRVAWLNPKMKSVQEDLDKALPDRINRVVSINRAGDIMLVWTGTAADPGRYYYYQTALGKMVLLAQPYNRLEGKQLAEVQSTSYHARDGLEIPSYLTVPPGPEPKALPLIVMPHGGPFVRDEWTYDVWAQFLANRGYLVLQPNYRGSTGYGKAFVEKGMGQWGRGMQDDIDDGVKWLVEQGKVDPRRVCIMGASYGGYAAMWAAARNPDLYRCAISFAGISDVAAMLRYDRKTFSAPRYFRSWRERVQGDEGFKLDTVSPLRNLDHIGIPLLIAHGAADDNVPLSQSRKLHEALTKAHKVHEYVVYEGEGHGLADPAHAIDFLKRVDTFLTTYNPADSRP